MPTAGTVGLLQLTMWPSRLGWVAEDTALLKEDFVGGKMMKRMMILNGSW